MDRERDTDLLGDTFPLNGKGKLESLVLTRDNVYESDALILAVIANLLYPRDQLDRKAIEVCQVDVSPAIGIRCPGRWRGVVKITARANFKVE